MSDEKTEYCPFCKGEVVAMGLVSWHDFVKNLTRGQRYLLMQALMHKSMCPPSKKESEADNEN